jgi:hypothetical protein
LDVTPRAVKWRYRRERGVPEALSKPKGQDSTAAMGGQYSGVADNSELLRAAMVLVGNGQLRTLADRTARENLRSRVRLTRSQGPNARCCCGCVMVAAPD